MSDDSDYLESLLSDTLSLIRQLELGVANRIPNLHTGILEHVIHIKFAHMEEPPITCPACEDDPRVGCESPYSDLSFLVKSVNQFHYLCSECHRQSEIPSFEIYPKEDGA